MIRLTRRYRFAALHRLAAPHFSEEENRAVYGKCANPHGHGHDYVLEVSVRGPVDRTTGRVTDVAALDRLVEARILARVRHRDLNREARDIAGDPPTTENLATGIRKALLEAWPEAFPAASVKLDGVRLKETRRNFFELT